MATVVIVSSSSTLQLSNANPLFSPSSPRISSPLKLHAPPHLILTVARATSDDDDDDDDKTDQTQTESSGSSEPENFENRLSQVRLRYKSGTGKKAEIRKSRKGKKGTSSSSSMYLPPVPLKEAVSEGLNVEFGFSPYSERVNGRIALLGLTALILVELATGQGVIKYHSPAIILIQVYFMAAASALYLKYEKEKVSVWPQSPSASDK